MIIRTRPPVGYSAVTPKNVYVNRRRFLATAGGVVVPAWAALAGAKLNVASKSPFSTTEPLTPLKDITSYNNFYEFGTQKNQPARTAQEFKTAGWKVTVEGDCREAGEFYDLDAIMKLAPLEERIYRLRCVEAWSMVVPWIGYPARCAYSSRLNRRRRPNTSPSRAITIPKQMPLAGAVAGIPFPYVEGLRMDEAMHPLTLLTIGHVRRDAAEPDGAPVRLVVPWKYGFKSIKSIVKIKLVEKQPPTTWNMANPHEYGFYSNVNPEVDHPRWSQAKERRLGEFLKRPTLMFNGYGDQVARCTPGWISKKNY